MNAAEKDNNNVNAKWKTNPFQVDLNVPDITDPDSESEYVLSHSIIPLKTLCDVNKQPTLTAYARSSCGQSTRESASVPIFSTWAKQESPPIKPARRTWQEISSDINRFAADNMKNAGWDDLWANKKKSQDRQVDETDLGYLSTRSLQDVCKSESVFQDSLFSQQKLQAWDKMMGLKRSHSRTMTKSSVTRKKMIHVLRELKMMREREKERDDRY